MRDDIEGARRAGYSDDQIAAVLGQNDPEIKAALDAGYKPAQVLSVAQDQSGQKARDAMKSQSWGDYVGDLAKGVVYGAGSEAKAVGTALAGPADVAPETRSAVAQGVSGAGSTLREAGSSVMPGADYRPAAFDVMHPVATASEIPKAAAEAAPGIGATMLAGAGAGAVGGMIAGPPGALAGSLGGAALYGFLRYWGGNAQAVAEKAGRAQPTQHDFDATLAGSAAQAGIDAATLKAAGVLGRVGGGAEGLARAVVGTTPVRGAGAQGVGAALGRAAENSGIMGVGAGVNNAIGQATVDGTVDPHEALNAAASGAGVGGMIAGARLPASATASIKFKAPDAMTGEAVGRLVDHMHSDAFAGDPGKTSQTAANVKALKGYTDDRLSALGADIARSASATDGGMTGEARAAAEKVAGDLKEYHRYLKTGSVFDRDQTATVADKFASMPEVRDALMDRSAANWIGQKAGQGENSGLVGRAIDMAIRHPGRAGAAGAILGEGAPMLMHGLHALDLGTTGGAVLGAALAAKALSKASGMSAVLERPLGMIGERYGSRPGEARAPLAASHAPDPAPSPTGTGEPVAAPPAPAVPPRAPEAPISPAAAPEAPQAAQSPLPRRPAGAATGHPPLSDLIAPNEARFTPSAPPEVSTPAAQPEATAPARRGPTSEDILGQMRIHAEAENQPLLDVAHLHHRSARAISTDVKQSAAQRAYSEAQASQIWHDIIKPLEAEATPEQVKRARSAKAVNEGPSPDVAGPSELSPTGRATLAAATPAFLKAIEAAKTPGEAARIADQFLGKFHGHDRAAVGKQIASTVKAIRAAHLKGAVHAAAKLKTSRTGKIKHPKSRKP